MLADYCTPERASPGGIADITIATPWKKSEFPSPSIYPLSAAQWLQVGLHVHVPSSMLDLAWFERLKVLCANTVSVSSQCAWSGCI